MSVSMYVDAYAFSSIIFHYLYHNPYGNLFHPHLHPHPKDHIILFRWYSCRMHNAHFLQEAEL